MVLQTIAAVVVGRSYDVVVDGIAVLTLVKLLSHHVVEIAAPKVKYLSERFAKISIKGRVYYWIEEAVAVAEPEKEARQGRGNRLIVKESPDQRQNEERQPAYGERAHYYSEGGARLSLLRQLKPQLLLVGRTRHAVEMVLPRCCFTAAR